MASGVAFSLAEILAEIVATIVKGEEGQLLTTVLEWISQCRVEVAKVLLLQLRECFFGWKEMVQQAVNLGIAVGQQLLQNAKSAIIDFCRGNKKLLEAIARLGTKTVVRAAATIAAKEVMKVTIYAVFKTAAKTVAKVSLNPVGIVADLTQEGLEMAGYKKEGKIVGKVGNIGSGALVGFMAGGPFGAAIGALTGAVIWSAGEVAGYFVEECTKEM